MSGRNRAILREGDTSQGKAGPVRWKRRGASDNEVNKGMRLYFLFVSELHGHWKKLISCV